MQLLPMLGMGGSVVFFFMTPNPIMRIMGMVMIASTIAMGIAMLVRYRRGTQGQLADMRRDYLKYLAKTRRSVLRTARLQRDAQFYLHPAPEQLWALVAEGSRIWERRISDEDFGQVRIGLGGQQLATPLVAPETAPVDELEPLTAGAMKQFLTAHSTIEGLPMAISLRAFYHLTISGDENHVRASARALLASLVALHSPDDLVVAIAAGGDAAPHWEWAKWIPHVQTEGHDGAGSRRLITSSAQDLELLLKEQLEGRPRFQAGGQPLLEQPHIVVVLDGEALSPLSALAAAEGLQGVTIVEVVPGQLSGARGGLSVVVHPRSLRLESGDGLVYEGTPDRLSHEAAEALALQLAPLYMASGGDSDEPLLANLEFTDLLDLDDAESVDVGRTWRPRSRAERLRVPIGVGEDGTPVMLDLKEAAQDGMGPHGLCVGATGSGKSEVLRTLVLGLAVTHSSETLNFILADFKGGATFAGMADMPHTAAVITNLADDLTLVDRMRDSIMGETQRRQELLRSAGNYANLHDYEKARAAGAALEPMASLVIVLDEFSELLTAKPDFIDMFIQIGRIGRSLGIHLLLASQRLEEGKLRGLDTYLSYRIGLRTFSAAESRTAIGVPDAYHLPSIPGSGYLRYDTDTMVRFKAAYVSGPYHGEGPSRVSRSTQLRPALFTAEQVALPPQPVVEEPEPDNRVDDALADTVLDVLVARMVNQGPPAHQVWLPPLDEAPSLEQLLPQLAVTPERGLTAPDYTALGRLNVPVGLVDKPFEQRRDVLYRDFSGGAGHGLFVGGPQSGKSTLLRSLISSFALTHTPSEVQFYCLDFGGGGLISMEELAHVGGVANRLDAEKVRRTVSEVEGILNTREEYFRTHNVDSIQTYRQRRNSGQLPDQPWGDVFLVIDGWATFKTDYEMLEATVTEIATRGLGFGVHVILTASRYTEVRPALKDMLQNRIELRLGDPTESEVDRKVAQNVPATVPGRGLTQEKLHFMAALPRVDGSSETDDLSEATSILIRGINDNWQGNHAPAVRLLPTMLPSDRLPKGFEHPDRGVAIGIDESSLSPVFVDFETDPLFIVFGESESGKSALLRLLIKQITERYTPDQAKIVMGDYRRAHLEGVPETHLSRYCASAPALTETLEGLAGSMNRRMPGPDVTPEQLRNRSWYSSPDAFVIVDDYDLVATGVNPLAPLLEYLPFARDIGLRIIIARASGGASRSLYEPVMQRMRELGAQGVVLSGDRSEGALLGNITATQLPPGRGYFHTRRRGGQLIQTGWLPNRF